MLKRVTAKKSREELLEADSDSAAGHGGGLQRSLQTLDLIAIGVGSTVGTGVFSITGQVASLQAGPAVALCWVIGGAGCFLSALSYMELSARIPVTGSVYAFAYHALGEIFAVVGAACITLEYGISASAVAANWSDKLKDLIAAWGAPRFASALSTQLGPVNVSLPALLLLLLVTIMIACGGALGKIFTRGSSLLAVLLIVTMSIVALVHFDASNLQPFVPPDLGFGGVLAGSVTTFFGFLGYDEVCCLAGEAADPSKSVPRAVVGTLFIATLLPVLGSIALCGLVPYTEIDKSAGFEVAFRDKGWPALSHAVALGELWVLFIVTYMCALAQPRVFYALAKDGLLPQKFLDVDSNGSPRFSTYVSGVLLMLCGAILPFDLLSNAISGGVLVAFTLVNCSVIVLRLQGGSGSDDARGLLRSRQLLGLMVGSFAVLSAVAAFLLRRAAGREFRLTAGYWTIGTAAAFGALAAFLGVLAQGRRTDDDDSTDTYFRVPCVPWVPTLGIVFNSIMLASLQMRDFALLMGYLVIVLIPYLIFVICRRTSSNAAPELEAAFNSSGPRH